MALRLRCPSCRKAFPWQPSEGMPDDCPLCGAKVGTDRADDDIVMPFIRSARTDRTDKVYRDMEAGSETRARIAAEMTGAPVSEMSALKITDLNSNQREGDIAAVLRPTAAEGQFFQPNGAQYMADNASGAVTVNGQVTTGIAPRAGATAVQSIRGAMGQGAWDVATVK